MLSQVRNTLKGAVAWFVIILLVLAFALFGVPNINQLSGNSAITVGGESFSGQYVQNEFNRLVAARRAQSSGGFTQEDAIASGLHNEVVSSITTTAALDQFSDKMNLSVPRNLVRDYLSDNENFQNPATGQFDESILREILRINNLTVTEFEKRIGEDLKRTQLIDALASRAPAPGPMVEAMILRDTERRQIAYLIVTEEMSGKAAEPTPTDIETYYAEHPSSFTAPEYRSFDMLVLRSQDFRDNLTVDEEELRRLYDLNKERIYDKPERRTVYQITFDTEAEALAASSALEQGKPFENLASENSLSLDDVTFADAQKSNILNPAVAEAAFAEGLEEGAIVGPVQSLFGWTVIQIAGVTPPTTSTFEEVRAEIEAQFLEQDTRRALLAAIDAVEEVRDTGAGLEAAAAEAGLVLITVGPVDRYSFAPGGAIIDNIPGEALRAAFNLEVDEESEAEELAARDGYFYVSVKDITPPAVIPFEDVRDEAEQKWRQQERNQRISATVKTVRDSLSEGQTFDEVAAQFNRSPTEMVVDQRFESDAISTAFIEQVFDATKGDIVSGPAALGEAQIVAEIRSIGYAANTVPPDQVNVFEQYMGYQLDQELIDAFITSVSNSYDVKLNQSQLDAIFGVGQ